MVHGLTQPQGIEGSPRILCTSFEHILNAASNGVHNDRKIHGGHHFRRNCLCATGYVMSSAHPVVSSRTSIRIERGLHLCKQISVCRGDAADTGPRPRSGAVAKNWGPFPLSNGDFNFSLLPNNLTRSSPYALGAPYE